ncbi:MAG: autotransporter outer membrane beta-barrel domain-containing protein [Woeseiaceae bacterium]|nr:autotransporter outer membrane beta-barrel domain-containing protein [Woeseiaceae bacterium]
MRTIKLLVLLIICAAGSASLTAHAQNPLVVFVQNHPDSTPLHMEVANAVAAICPRLGAEGGFGLSGPEGDLFARCNEMIATACQLNDPTDPNCPGRSLGVSDDELLGAVQEIWGEELHGTGNATTRLTNGQFSNIAGRMNALRLGGASGAIGGRAAAAVLPEHDDRRGSPGYGELSLDSRGLSGGGAAGDVAGSRWGWFLEGSFSTGDHDQTANEDGFDFDSISFSVGLDYLFDSGVIGIAVGQDNFEAEFDQNMFVTGGDVEVEGTSGSIFGAWFGDGFYVDGLVTYGSLDNDMSRKLVYSSTDMCAPACPPQNDLLTGETDGDYLAAGVSFGYEAQRGAWDITTTLSVAYRDIDIDGFDEIDTTGGGMALRYSDQEIESLRSILGIAFTGNFSRGFGVLSPHFRAEWHHEFEDDPVFINAKYVNEDFLMTVPPGDFTGSACLSCVRWGSDPVDTDFALLGAGVSAVFSRRVQLYFMYDALIGIDNLSSNTFSLGLRGQF